jgi:hypothetical protein
LSIQLYTSSDCSTGAVAGQLYSKTLANATLPANRTITSNNQTFTLTAPPGTPQTVSWLVKFVSTDSNVTGTVSKTTTQSHCETSTVTITN